MARTAGIIIVLTGAIAALLIVVAMRSPTPQTGAGDLRIVALSPALAITLVDLGLEEHIVGRHAWDYVLDKAIPVCGDQSGIDFEVLVSTRPTHVLTEWGSQSMPERLLAGEWELHDLSMLSLDEVATSVVALAALFDGHVDPRRDELASAASMTPFELLERMIPQGEARYQGRVLLLWPTNPPAAVGPGSFHQQVFERVGGRPAMEQGGAYIELDAETILTLAPDAVMIIAPRRVGEPAREYDWAAIVELLGLVADLDVPAVRDRRVVVLDDSLALTPSTALIDFGRDVRTALEVWGRE